VVANSQRECTSASVRVLKICKKMRMDWNSLWRMLDNEPENEWSVPEGTTFICTPNIRHRTQKQTLSTFQLGLLFNFPRPSPAPSAKDPNQHKLPTTFHTHLDTT
jgi:hypothetical protein